MMFSALIAAPSGATFVPLGSAMTLT
jgi:hypothetical protein